MGAVEAGAQEPAPGELILAGNVKAEGRDDRAVAPDRGQHGPRPDQFAARHERVIDSPPQGLPPQRGVGAVKLVPGIGPGAVAARERATQVDIGGFVEVAVEPQMPYGGDVAALVGLEDAVGVSAEDLRRAFEEDAFGGGQDAAEREAGVVDSVLAAQQILAHQRAVGPGQHVVVQRVHFAKCGAHLAHL